MQKVLLAILTVSLLMGLSLPAYAADEVIPDMTEQGEIQPQEPTQDEQQPGEQQEAQDSPVVVSTYDELQAAVDAAEDGDIIAISDSIYVNAVLTTDKSITLTRADNFNKVLLYLKDDGRIEGFTFEEAADAYITIDIFDSENSFINNCTFKGKIDHNVPFVEIYRVYNQKTSVSIENCSFYGNGRGAISIKSNTEVEIHGCTFDNNSTWLQGGAISNNGGNVIIEDCIITNNNAASGGGVFNAGELTIKSSKIYSNTITNSKLGSDILSYGTLSIDNCTLEDVAIYDEATGEKLTLPLVGYTDTARLTYLTEEQAAKYFAPEPPQDEKPAQPEPGNDGDSEDTPPEQPEPPQEPGNQTGENNNTDGEQPPQEPTQPPEGNNNDNPDNGEQKPTQPPTGEDDGQDNPTDNPPNAPEQPVEQPQQPIGGSSDTTPPVSHRPIHKPTTSITTPANPAPSVEPEKPKLSCGGAAINTSRTVVLLGYGDGLQHEQDPLTRAQLAEIIYRLLDEKSIAEFDIVEQAFIDVSPDSWCYKSVQIIQKAGIVAGTGGGCYSPNGLVTWSQIVTVLSRFVEPQEYTLQHIQYNGWAQEAIQTAVALGWIEDKADFKPDAVIARGELVQLINNVLELNR